MSDERSITQLDAAGIETVVENIATEIASRHPSGPLALVGIHTGGVILAQRLAAHLSDRGEVLEGTIDISLYRDDLNRLQSLPKIKGSDIPFEVEGATILLCDDVLYTGRTIRAAINVLTDYGRPAKIELAVLADRGHRELPIAPDYCGIEIETEKDDYLRVHFADKDGVDDIVHTLAEEA